MQIDTYLWEHDDNVKADDIYDDWRINPLVVSIPGSSDADMPPSLLHSMQNQMQSKGGYEMAYGVKVIIIKLFSS